MDPLDVEGYLTQKGVAYKTAGAYEINTHVLKKKV